MYNFFRSITRIVFFVFLFTFISVYLSMLVVTGIAIKNNLEYNVSFVYKILPVLIVKDTGVFISKENQQLFDVAACSTGPVIIMTPGCWQDTDILNHELCHAKQSYRGLFIIHTLKNYLSVKHRVLYEYEAYNVEKFPPTKEEFIDIMSSSLYGSSTKLQIEQVLAAL